MKNSKRLFALLLAVCLILSMTVPAVWAEDTAGVLSYYFGFEETGKAKDGTTFLKGNLLNANANPYAGDPATCAGYPLIIKDGSGSGNFLNSSNVPEGLEGNPNYITARYTQDRSHWFAFEICNVSKGTYDMKFQYGINKNSGIYEIYVIPYASYNATIGAEALNKLAAATNLTKAENEAIIERVASCAINKDSITSFDAYAATSGAGYYNTEVTFPEAGSYVVLFRNVGKNEASSQRRLAVQKLTMTPVGTEESEDDKDDSGSADVGTETAYYFGFEETGKAKDGTTFLKGNLLNANANPYAGDPATCAGYPLIIKDGSGSGYFLNSSNVPEGLEGNPNYITARYTQNRSHWFAFEICNVSKGTYDMKLQYYAAKNAGIYEIYVIPYASYNAAIGAEALNKLAAATNLSKADNEAIIERVASCAINKDSVTSFDAYAETSAESFYNMEVTFPEAGSYVVLFHNVGKNEASSQRRLAVQMLTVTSGAADGSDDGKDDSEVEDPGNGGFDGKLPTSQQTALEAAVSTIYCTHMATDVVNGHDYIYLLFRGSTMMVYDLDEDKLVDVKRNVFSTGRGIYIDENHIVWVCGATNSLYRYDPFTKTGEHKMMDMALIPFEGGLNLLGITGDGNGHLYFGSANRGHLGMYDTKTGEFSKISEHLDADVTHAGYGGVVLKDGYAYLEVAGNVNGDAEYTHKIIKYDLANLEIVDSVDTKASMGSLPYLNHLSLVGDKYLFGAYSSEMQGTVLVDISGEKMKLVDLEGVSAIIGEVSDEIDGKVYYMGRGTEGLMAFDIATGKATATGIASSGALMACYGGNVTVDGLEGESIVTITGSNSVDLVFYNPASGKTVTRKNVTDGMGSGNILQAITTSEDGKNIYVGAYGANGVTVYDVENGKAVDSFSTTDHQTDGLLMYEGTLYVGNYAGCCLSTYDLENHKLTRLTYLSSTPFKQERIHTSAAGDGVVYFATIPAKGNLGGVLVWHNIAENRIYVAAGPNPEDVYYTTAGNTTAKGWYKATTGELADKELDTNGDGTVNSSDCWNSDGEQRFTGVIKNQVVNNMVYVAGYLIGSTSRTGGSGAAMKDENNAQLFVYDTKTMKVVAYCDVTDTIDGLVDGRKIPISYIDAVAADPEEEGKF